MGVLKDWLSSQYFCHFGSMVAGLYFMGHLLHRLGPGVTRLDGRFGGGSGRSDYEIPACGWGLQTLKKRPVSRVCLEARSGMR